MRATVQPPNGSAISCAVQTAIKSTDPVQLDSDDENWFAELARSLLHKDAGFALHILTGFEERTCYRYAAGDRKPPAYFLRALLRSEQGDIWLAALMENSSAQWWLDFIRSKRIAEQIRKLDLR